MAVQLRNQDDILRKLEGLHTIETAMIALGLKRQSTLNLLCKLKKQQYVITSGGGKRKRLYRISQLKQRPRDPGMFDIINKYSPHMKVAEWYDHQVHGVYGPEEALIDAIETESFRLILASLHLFKHIKNWKKLYKLANEHGCWNKVGALYDVARLFFKVTRIPSRYYHIITDKWVQLSQLRKLNFPDIAQKWHVFIPFNINDIREV